MRDFFALQKSAYLPDIFSIFIYHKWCHDEEKTYGGNDDEKL